LKSRSFFTAIRKLDKILPFLCKWRLFIWFVGQTPQIGTREARGLAGSGAAERNAHNHANNDADKNNNDDGGETDYHPVLLLKIKIDV
jgi:hypothetical protein